MIRLQANTEDQRMYLTLRERRTFLDSYDSYLFCFENQATREKVYFIGDIEGDTDRYTIINISTDDNDELNGNVEITKTGMYWYTVYAQTGGANLDPSNAVGVLETGLLQVWDNEQGYNVPDITFNDFIVVE